MRTKPQLRNLKRCDGCPQYQVLCSSPCLSCGLTILTKTELTSQLCKVLVSNIEKIFCPSGVRWGDTGGGKGNRAIKASSSQLLIFNWLAISPTLFSLLPPRSSVSHLISLCNYNTTTTIKYCQVFTSDIFIQRHHCRVQTSLTCPLRHMKEICCDHGRPSCNWSDSYFCCFLWDFICSWQQILLTARCFSHSFHGIKLPPPEL